MCLARCSTCHTRIWFIIPAAIILARLPALSKLLICADGIHNQYLDRPFRIRQADTSLVPQLPDEDVRVPSVDHLGQAFAPHVPGDYSSPLHNRPTNYLVRLLPIKGNHGRTHTHAHRALSLSLCPLEARQPHDTLPVLREPDMVRRVSYRLSRAIICFGSFARHRQQQHLPVLSPELHAEDLCSHPAVHGSKCPLLSRERF